MRSHRVGTEVRGHGGMNAAPLAETRNTVSSITWTQSFQTEKTRNASVRLCTSLPAIDAESDGNLHEVKRVRHCVTSL